MIKISMREFTLNVAKYMERVHKGECFVIVKREKPIANILPHTPQKSKAGWSYEIPKKIVKGPGLAEELVEYRKKERS
ncbi:MAG: hypothetical protein KC733_11430 [Candidatus Omnitrophica bacterium]|nr:hypothetical protein [Candidatus Omnitrophota bacterium]